MDSFINFELLKNPINWIIVVLMVAMGTLMLSYIARTAATSA